MPCSSELSALVDNLEVTLYFQASQVSSTLKGEDENAASTSR